MKNLYCVSCGEKAGECFHKGDVSPGVDYNDEYEFICKNCGYKVVEYVYRGDSGHISRETKCPFCKK